MKEIDKTIHLKCDCGTHILQVNYHAEPRGNNNELIYQEWNFINFEYSGAGKPSLMWRLRNAWKLIVSGKFHEDEIVLDNDEALKLRNFINDNQYV